jgi:hypothetical protein
LAQFLILVGQLGKLRPIGNRPCAPRSFLLVSSHGLSAYASELTWVFSKRRQARFESILDYGSGCATPIPAFLD